MGMQSRLSSHVVDPLSVYRKGSIRLSGLRPALVEEQRKAKRCHLQRSENCVIVIGLPTNLINNFNASI